MLGFLKSPGRFDVSDPSRPTSFGEPVVLPNTDEDHLFRQILSTARVGSTLYLPVVWSDEVIGMFGLPDALPDALTRALQTARSLVNIGYSVSNHWQRHIDRVLALVARAQANGPGVRELQGLIDTIRDGLAFDECNQMSSMVDRTGRLLVGTSTAVSWWAYTSPRIDTDWLPKVTGSVFCIFARTLLLAGRPMGSRWFAFNSLSVASLSLLIGTVMFLPRRRRARCSALAAARLPAASSAVP